MEAGRTPQGRGKQARGTKAAAQNPPTHNTKPNGLQGRYHETLMEPILTDDIVQMLTDPYGHFDDLLSDPVVYVMMLWAKKLPAEVTPTDFILTYYGLIQDLQDGTLRSPLQKAPPQVFRLLFALFPYLLPRLLGPRAKEVEVVWRELLQTSQSNGDSMSLSQ